LSVIGSQIPLDREQEPRRGLSYSFHAVGLILWPVL
jgi:hypothetical protein